jgi:hypothetical protein
VWLSNIDDRSQATRRAFLAGSAGLLLPRFGPSFGQLVNELSEPETGPPADNLISNEDSYPRVAGALAKQAPPGGVYLGVGPDQNFSLIAHARFSQAFIADYRRRNMLLHFMHKALFTLANDRVSYLSLLTARTPAKGFGKQPTGVELVNAFGGVELDRGRLEASVRDVATLLKPFGIVKDDEWKSLAQLQAKLAGPGMNARFLALKMYPTFGQMISTPGHFLTDDGLFEAIQSRQRNDQIVPIVADFSRPDGLRRLRDYLSQTGQKLSVLYISDVEFFLLRNGRWNSYISTLKQMPWADGAVIVRTSTREIKHPERVAGDSSTTIISRAATFLDRASKGQIRSVDDLFFVR